MPPPLFLTDQQVTLLEHNPEYQHFGNSCPVCRDEGEYRYKGETHACPDDEYGHPMLRLAKLYWLHNIPLQYQQLDWADYPRETVKPDIDTYIEQYEFARLAGMGISFMSKALGVGKTWGATHVLKELVKKGYDGWFVSFADIPRYKDMEDKVLRRFRIERLQSAELVVIDDVTEPWTPPMREYFANALEQYVRPRTDSNLPTIITTNMSPDGLEDAFPRIFSLLMAKNLVIEISGQDARVDGRVWDANMKLVLAGETRPIT